MTKLPSDEYAIPCGLHAMSFFNDNYKVIKVDDSGNELEIVDISEKDIAWKNDATHLFKNTPKQIQDMVDVYKEWDVL